MITSPDNPALKDIRKLRSSSARSKQGLFVAEGEDLLAAADAGGWKPVRRLCAAGSGLDGIETAQHLLDSVSLLGSGTRTIAVYERKLSGVPAAGLIVHLHGLSDPGNVGTCIRSAHALGATGVSLGPETADPFGPKAVRASMGSVFALPLSQCSDPLELRGTKVALATRGGKRPSNGLAGPSVLLVGSERDGLPRKLIDGADILWTFELDEGAESLNAASACSIALHVANRMPVE